MNQKTLMYLSMTFIAFALLSKFSAGGLKAKSAAIAPPKKKKKSGIGGFLKKAVKVVAPAAKMFAGGMTGGATSLLGFDADGEPVYGSEASVI